MGKKIKIYESEIKRATRRKLMERYVDEDYEMSDTYSKRDFKPTPKERGVEGVFGKYGDDMDPAVVRYMRKNPDHILRRMAKLYPDIYMRHIPLQSNTELEMDDVMMGEAEETTVKQTKYTPDEVKRAEQKGMGISVNGSVTLDKDGGMTVTTKNESTQKLFKKFLNRK